MKILTMIRGITSLAVMFFCISVTAQEAKTLDELLDMIESSAISETAESKKRKSDFVRDQRKQAGLLKQARDTEAAEERRSDR